MIQTKTPIVYGARNDKNGDFFSQNWGTLLGGGSVVCPVFYNGSAWVAH